MELPRDAIFATTVIALMFRCIAEIRAKRERSALRRILSPPAPPAVPPEATPFTGDGRWI